VLPVSYKRKVSVLHEGGVVYDSEEEKDDDDDWRNQDNHEKHGANSSQWNDSERLTLLALQEEDVVCWGEGPVSILCVKTSTTRFLSTAFFHSLLETL
jgi:hypothetical protein